MFGEPGREIQKQGDFFLEIGTNKSERGPGHAESRNDAAAFVKNGSGNTAQPLFQFFVVGSISPAAGEVENDLKFPETWDRKGRIQLHAVAKEDIVGFTFREPGEDGFGGGSAMRGEKLADESADGDDGIGGIDAVETDDAAGARNGEADTFSRTTSEFDEKRARFGLQRPRQKSAVAEFVKFEAETIFFVERVPFNQMKLLHGGEETVGGALIDGEIGGDLREAQFGAVLSQMQQNAHGFLQGLAGAGAGIGTVERFRF